MTKKEKCFFSDPAIDVMSVFLLLTVCLFLQVIVSSLVNINHTIF